MVDSNINSGGIVLNDAVHLLLEKSKKINESTVTLTRTLIMALLEYFIDGIQFRELSTALNISDGKLISNLNKLIDFEYVGKFEEQIENKKINIYYLTKSGKAELKRIIEWMDLIKEVIAEGDDKCQ